MIVKGIDLTVETGLQGDFGEVLNNVTKSSCYFSIDFSPTNNRSRRALASGTQVKAYLGYSDDTAADYVHTVVRDPQFASTVERKLRAVSDAFEDVVLADLEVEFVTSATTLTNTTESTTTTEPTTTTTESTTTTKSTTTTTHAELTTGASASIYKLTRVH